MEPSDGRRLMWRDERRFGWQVGLVLSLLGVVRLWRHAPARAATGAVPVVALLLISVGVALIVAAFVIPQRLVTLRRAWLAFGDRLQRITGPVVTTLLYFLLVTPIGWIRRTFSRSPLARDRDAASFWVSPHEGEIPGPPRHDKPY